MADDAPAILEDLANELRPPDDAAGWRDIIEALPDLLRMLAERFHVLGEALSEQGGPAVQQTTAGFHDLAGAVASSAEEAGQLALAWDDESSFWMSGG